MVVFLVLPGWRQVSQSEFSEGRYQVNKYKLYIVLISQKMAISQVTAEWVLVGPWGEMDSLPNGKLPDVLKDHENTHTHTETRRERAIHPIGALLTAQARAWWTIFSTLTLSHTHGRQCPFASCCRQLGDAAGQTQADVKSHLAWRGLI